MRKRAVRTHTPRGHGLAHEGAPHDAAGRLRSARYPGTSGIGRAKCVCGALSDELDSGAARKRWHKEHKAEIAAQN